MKTEEEIKKAIDFLYSIQDNYDLFSDEIKNIVLMKDILYWVLEK